MFLTLCPVILLSGNVATATEDQRKVLESELTAVVNRAHAKNVILFVGDGMGVSTVTAARIFDGQRKGLLGEENSLSFEQFPFLALSKTYSANQQTPDSAPTMSAMMTGVKTNGGVIGVDESINFGEESWQKIVRGTVPNLIELAEQAGLSTGIVTTSRLTHATPAACFAHTSNRNCESDADVPTSSDVPDIASQFVDFSYGDGIDVALGGGLSAFIPTGGSKLVAGKGKRDDGRDLIEDWARRFPDGSVVFSREELLSLPGRDVRKVFGIFSESHMPYRTDFNSEQMTVPTLPEMTRAAIETLSKNERGFFLHVESARIDHGHHANNAYRALAEVVELSRAVDVALDMVDLKETLIIVTADHSHVFTISGYPKRGNPILGKVIEPGHNSPKLDADGRPYTTLGYVNGPGMHVLDPGGDMVYDELINAGRENLDVVDTESPTYHQETLIPLSAETHGGEDVAIYATGPSAYLFRGVKEQNYVFEVMAYALKLKGNK